jgi:hypothetical protein
MQGQRNAGRDPLDPAGVFVSGRSMSNETRDKNGQENTRRADFSPSHVKKGFPKAA